MRSAVNDAVEQHLLSPTIKNEAASGRKDGEMGSKQRGAKKDRLMSRNSVQIAKKWENGKIGNKWVRHCVISRLNSSRPRRHIWHVAAAHRAILDNPQKRRGLTLAIYRHVHHGPMVKE